MKNPRNLKLLGISLLLAAALTACDKTPGPAESAGKQIDQVALDAGKKIEQSAADASKAIEKTAEKVGEKMSEQGAKTAVAIDDTEITTKVKAAIFAEEGLKTLQISVDTVKGVVTLSGSVNSISNSETAKSLAAAVTGVTEVINNLVVKTS